MAAQSPKPQSPKPGSEARYLRTSSTFERFSPQDVQRVVDAATRTSLPANWPLIHERTPGDACYILLSGTVAVFAGQDRIAELGAGEVTGELAVRHGRLRSATVSTLEPVELLRIEGAALERLLHELPAFRETLDTVVADHGG